MNLRVFSPFCRQDSIFQIWGQTCIVNGVPTLIIWLQIGLQAKGGVLEPTLNLSTLGTKVNWSNQSLRPICSTQRVPGQSGLHSKTLSQKTNNQTAIKQKCRDVRDSSIVKNMYRYSREQKFNYQGHSHLQYQLWGLQHLWLQGYLYIFTQIHTI